MNKSEGLFAAWSEAFISDPVLMTTTTIIQSRKFAFTNGWGDVATISSDLTQPAGHPDIGIDSYGSLFAAWIMTGDSTQSICYDHFTVGSSWGETGFLDTDGLYDFVKVTVDRYCCLISGSTRWVRSSNSTGSNNARYSAISTIN